MEFIKNPTYETLIVLLVIIVPIIFHYSHGSKIKKISIILILVIIISILGYLYINRYTIKGKVMFENNKSAVIGAKVKINEVDREAITNEEGEYIFRFFPLESEIALKIQVEYPNYKNKPMTNPQNYDEDGNNVYLINKEQVDENY